MAPTDFMTLAQQCAPQVAPATLVAIVRTESGFNPYAIGVVHGHLIRQPQTLAEAIATTHSLETQGWNYSVGLAQVNRANFAKYGLTSETAFMPCRNLAAGAAILRNCFEAAQRVANTTQQALRASLSCYASGDWITGYRTGYVQRVVANANAAISVIPTTTAVPAIVPGVMPIPVVRMDERARVVDRTTTGFDPPADARDSAASQRSGDSAVVF
jgi:type IV secretion system protein VirB1